MSCILRVLRALCGKKFRSSQNLLVDWGANKPANLRWRLAELGCSPNGVDDGIFLIYLLLFDLLL
ncbi:MAG: hypothetical protein ACRCUY_04760 [Thermoguttaceae bacterium]